MPSQLPETVTNSETLLRENFERLQNAWTLKRPDYQQRIDDLRRLRTTFKSRLPQMAQAISADFGHRSYHESLLGEAMVVLTEIDLCLTHLKRWMKPQRRKAGWQLWPAKAEIHYMPLGVVGVIAPWNYPVNLALCPLIAAIAAGNHVFLKPSEHTPHTGAFLQKLLADVFPQEKVMVVQGGADIASAFASLPFDHLFFTGSTTVGRKVMSAAALNLTPVTLELGGKSPAIITPSADLKQAAERIATGKFFNAGQTCIAPDYVLVPAQHRDEFVQFFSQRILRRYDQLDDHKDYTTIINDHQYQRLTGLIRDAIGRGHTVLPLIRFRDLQQAETKRLIAPTLVLEPDLDSAIMQEEIFGPLLPVISYQTIDEAIALIKRLSTARRWPLALYCFGQNEREIEPFLTQISAGGICINDTLFQFVCHDLPFGGVSASGMGHYHGVHGFQTFSKAMPVLRKYNPAFTDRLKPPYRGLADRIVQLFTR